MACFYKDRAYLSGAGDSVNLLMNIKLSTKNVFINVIKWQGLDSDCGNHLSVDYENLLWKPIL